MNALIQVNIIEVLPMDTVLEKIKQISQSVVCSYSYPENSEVLISSDDQDEQETR